MDTDGKRKLLIYKEFRCPSKLLLGHTGGYKIELIERADNAGGGGLSS